MGPGGRRCHVVSYRHWASRAEDSEDRPVVTASPGETVELAFERCTERCIEVVFADGVPAAALDVRVLDAQGRTFDEDHYEQIDHLVRDGRYGNCIGGLLMGDYSIEVQASDGRSASGEPRVLELAADDTSLVPTLR